MLYSANCFRIEPAYRVTKVRIETDELYIEWIWDGETCFLKADSSDGVSYRGNYGYSQQDPERKVELICYDNSNGDVVLVGRWWNEKEGGGESWIFRCSTNGES